MSLEPEQVEDFVDSIPIIAHAVLSMDKINESLLDEVEDDDENIIKHTEEMLARKNLDNKHL